MALLIRLAAAEDAAAIAELYRPYVEHRRISFEEEAPEASEIARRMSNPIHPWLVAEDDGKLLAFCRSGTRSAYTCALAHREEGASREEVEERLNSAGFDCSPIAHLL